MDSIPKTDSERLARLEVEVEGMRAQFSSQLSGLGVKIDALANSQSEARKPRWDTWAAWLAVAITIVGGGAWAIDRRFVTTEERADRNYDLAAAAMRQTSEHEARMSERLGEIETQFRSGGQTYNQTDYRHDLLIDQLWQKTFGQSLSEDAPWPVLGRER